VIDYLEGQDQNGPKGGNMRLGAYKCTLKENSLAHTLYQVRHISERHRHRLEVNNAYVKTLAEKGLIISGTHEEKNLVEVIEIGRDKHPFFIACQFHPEFKSKPFRPHPLFEGLILATLAYQNAKDPSGAKVTTNRANANSETPSEPLASQSAPWRQTDFFNFKDVQ
jgi:CTP synthase